MVDLANAFAGRGYTADILVLKPVGQLESHVEPNVRVISLDRGRMALSLFPLISYLRREKPEVILALEEYSHLLSILARKFSGSKTRVVLRIGNMLSELFKRYEGFKNKLLPFLVKWLYKKADGIIAVSKGVRDDIIAVTKIDPKRVHVVYQPKRLEYILSRAKEPTGHVWLERKTLPVIIAAGRLRVQKNLPFLIRAFAEVIKEIPARLIIIGTGREEGRLRDLIREIGCEDSISLPGYSDNPYAFMSKADVYVSATLWEGMPNALLEALALGLPVISSDCDSGPREIIAPDTDYKFRLKNGIEYAKYGILCAVNDSNAFIEAMKKLLSDNELRLRYRKAGLERSRDFDIEDIIGKYANALGVSDKNKKK